jgi:hypothetical protein
MSKDNKVNIKLEICRDKNSGRLGIMAHFTADAPNVTIYKDEYIWNPTPAEKDLINEVFELMSPTAPLVASAKPVTTVPEPAIGEAIPEPEIKKGLEINEEPEKDFKPEIKEKPIEESSIKKEETAVFEVYHEQPIEKDIDNAIDEKDMDVKVEIKDNEESTSELPSEYKKEEKDIIISADEEAIEAALKKHSDKDKDESIKEADEKTIVDKVLSQKKKGKWSR